MKCVKTINNVPRNTTQIDPHESQYKKGLNLKSKKILLQFLYLNKLLKIVWPFPHKECFYKRNHNFLGTIKWLFMHSRVSNNLPISEKKSFNIYFEYLINHFFFFLLLARTAIKHKALLNMKHVSNYLVNHHYILLNY